MIVGILGGSGLYDLAGTDLRSEPVTTPFGAPSAPPRVGRLGELAVAFIPRHGHGHRLLPSEVNYRANLHAFKQLGVERVISVSAVGSMKEGIHPGDVVIVDQFIDRTHGRASTYFGEGLAGHVGYAEPVCPELLDLLHAACLGEGFEDAGADRGVAGRPGRPARVLRGGTYVCMEGPQFSTRAESLLHRSWGVDVVGMTAATEAKLCREAELCYGVLAFATDYDCWRPDEAAVSATAVVEVLSRNVARAQRILAAALAAMPAERKCTCGQAAARAIMTARDAVPAATREKLDLLFGRYLP